MSWSAEKRYNVFKWIVLIVPCLWLVAAGILVKVEVYDGYDVICNAAHFCGEGNSYFQQRAPLMALIMIPARLLSRAFDMGPFDPTLYHLAMVLLHVAYILLVYLIIERLRGRRPAVIVAFAAAVLNFLFFSYGVFISHDIFPGLLFLVMLMLVWDYWEKGGLWRLLAIVLIGAAAALIKQTYGLFWLTALIGMAVAVVPRVKKLDREQWLRLGTLAAGSVVSGLLYWLIMAAILGSNYPDRAFLIRPWLQVSAIMGQYQGKNMDFPWWVYLRNFPAYGALSCCLVIPALVMAWRKSGRDRFMAVVWIAGVAALQATGMREVRYLIFLMPLTAFLIVLPIEWFLTQRSYRGFMFVILAIDLGVGAWEGSRIFSPFYRNQQLERFLTPVVEAAPKRPVVLAWNYLSFLSDQSPFLAGDRFHRIFHVGPDHVRILLRKQPGSFHWFTDLSFLKPEYICKEGTFLIVPNRLLVNSDALVPDCPSEIKRFKQCLAVSEPVKLVKAGDEQGFPMADWEKNRYTQSADGVLIVNPVLSRFVDSFLYVCVYDPESKRGYPMVKLPDGRLLAVDLKNPDLLKENPQLWGYRLLEMMRYSKDAQQ